MYEIVVEVQLHKMNGKRFVLAGLRRTCVRRLKCPVALLVVTADETVARWAARPIIIGGLNQFTPYVLRPSSMPEIVDESVALNNPELAVLSTMAHGRDSDVDKALHIALAAHAAVLGSARDRLQALL